MPKLPVRVSKEESEAREVGPNDHWNEWSGQTKGECPTSTHPRKVHVGRSSVRITVTTTWSNGQKTKSYVDTCQCKFCGHTWQQEWMSA